MFQFHDCCVLGDRAYLSVELQQDLFSSVGIKLEVPYRLNMKNWRPTFKPYAKARKRIETNFSQLCDSETTPNKHQDCLAELSGKLAHSQSCNI